MTQVWHSVVDTLRLLPTVPSKSGEAALHETQTIDDALEKLDLLIAMRQAPDGRSSGNPTFSVNEATPDTPSTSGGIKRKRRPSVSVSPVPPALTTGASFDSNLSSLASPLPPRKEKDRSATPISHHNAHSAKHAPSQASHPSTASSREPYADQLPLNVGRRVAFRMPAKDGEEQEWILATIKRCLLQDKTRYEVVDADDPTK